MSISIVNTTVFSNPGNLGNGTFSLSAPATPGNALIFIVMNFGLAVPQWVPPGTALNFLTTNADGVATEVPAYTLNPFNNVQYALGNWWEASGGSSLTGADVLYIVSTNGATSVSFVSGFSPKIWVYEVSGLGAFTVDAFALNGSNGSNHAPVVGPALTGSGSNDLCISVCPTENNSYSSVSAPWIIDSTFILGCAPSHVIGSGTQPAPTYNDASDDFTGLSVAFKAAPPASNLGLYKLNPSQAFDEHVTGGVITDQAINSAYFTYGFVNSSKASQNPLLGFHRKRYSEVQFLLSGSGNAQITCYPNYILQQSLSFNPYLYQVPPIPLQVNPIDDYVRPLNVVGNRVFVEVSTNAVGAAFKLSKLIMVGAMDSLTTVNPNAI